MKKIFFMAVTAVFLAAGCQKTEIQNEELTPIGFNTQMGKLTKSPDAGNPGRYDNLIEQNFRVWGYFATSGDINYDQYDNYLGSEKKDATGAIDVIVTKDTHADGSPICNTGDETYYWPGKNKELDLYAVSLWNDQTATPNNTYAKVSITPSTHTLKITDFEVNDSADDDLMVAPLIRQDQDDSKYVEPQFQHALTKVLVNFKATVADGVSVVSAKLTGVESKGTLTVTNTLSDTEAEGATTSTADFVWNSVSTPKEYSAEYSGDKITVSATKIGETSSTDYQAAKLNAENYITFGSWLFIPQENKTVSGGEEDTSTTTYGIDDVTLVVDYIVDGIYVSQTFDLAPENATVVEWARNKQTTYNVLISPDYITFEPDVADWADENENTNDEERGDFEL